MSSTTPLWTPSHERISASNLQQFIAHVNMQGEAIDSYSSLHQCLLLKHDNSGLRCGNFAM